MFLKNWIFSKEFEINIVDSFGFVLGYQPSKKTSEHVRYIMDGYELTEDERLCLHAVLNVLKETTPIEGAYNETITPKAIEENLLTIPTDVFIKTFERLSRRFEALIELDAPNVPKGYVSGFYGVHETIIHLLNFFSYLRCWVRQEFKNVAEDAFGVRVPDIDITPEDLPEPFTDKDFPCMVPEDIDTPEPEPQEFDINPIY